MTCATKATTQLKFRRISWGYLFLEKFCVSNEQNFFNIQKKKPKTLLSPTTSTKPAPKHLPGQTNAYIKEATAVPPQTYTNSA